MACLDVNVPKKPRARFSRFSLKALLLFVGIAGFAPGWVGMEVDAARRQGRAIRAVLAMGGAIDYRHDGAGEPLWPDWLIECIGPECFARPRLSRLPTRGVAAISEGGLRHRHRHAIRPASRTIAPAQLPIWK